MCQNLNIFANAIISVAYFNDLLLKVNLSPPEGSVLKMIRCVFVRALMFLSLPLSSPDTLHHLVVHTGITLTYSPALVQLQLTSL